MLRFMGLFSGTFSSRWENDSIAKGQRTKSVVVVVVVVKCATNCPLTHTHTHTFHQLVAFVFPPSVWVCVEQEKDGGFDLLVTRQRGVCPGLVFFLEDIIVRDFIMGRGEREASSRRQITYICAFLHFFQGPTRATKQTRTHKVHRSFYLHNTPTKHDPKKVLVFVFARGQGSKVLLLVVVANFFLFCHYFGRVVCVELDWLQTSSFLIFQHRAPSFFFKQLTNLIFLKFINQFLAR